MIEGKKILLAITLSTFVLLPTLVRAYTFVNPLRLGNRGEDVIELQKILNSDSATQIATQGAGSPGQETDYFGAMTRLAVIKFQEKYAGEVLYPSGLTVGTGVVGQNTLKKLNILVVSATTKPKSTVPTVRNTTPRPYTTYNNSIVPTGMGTPALQSPTYLPTTSDQAPASASSLTNNAPITQYGSTATLPAEVKSKPNFEDYDMFMSEIRQVGRQQGYSEERLAQVEKAVYEGVSTTTNLREMFLKEDEAKRKVSEATRVDLYKGIRQFYVETVNKLADALLPKAVAQGSCPGGMPFGSIKMFPILLCTCSGNWLVGMVPTGPNYLALVTHYAGMQSFLNFSAPFGMSWLGCYTPGPGNCMFLTMCGIAPCCIMIPAQGMTTPFLGSS